MAGYSAVLFDLDGTLLDTLEDLAACGNRTLAGLGFSPHPPAAYRLFVGDGLRTLIERILPPAARSEEVIVRAMALFREDYGANWQVRTTIYPGVARMLDTLAARGFRLSILSNKPHVFTRACVSSLLPAWSFHPQLGQREGVPKKPDPTAALEIAEALGLPPAAILYVGDTATDMETAARAGMDAVGVLWGFRGADELRAAGARHLIEAPDQLPDLLSSP